MLKPPKPKKGKAQGQYSGDTSKLQPGSKNRWKFVHRINLEEAVCLASKLFDSEKESTCKAIIPTKSSNSEGILQHYRRIHKIEVDQLLKEDKMRSSEALKQHLVKRKFNDIITMKSEVAVMVCVDLLTLNQLLKSKPIARYLKKEFGAEITTFDQIRKIITEHFTEVVTVMKNEISK